MRVIWYVQTHYGYTIDYFNEDGNFSISRFEPYLSIIACNHRHADKNVGLLCLSYSVVLAHTKWARLIFLSVKGRECNLILEFSLASVSVRSTKARIYYNTILFVSFFITTVGIQDFGSTKLINARRTQEQYWQKATKLFEQEYSFIDRQQTNSKKRIAIQPWTY